RLSLSLFTTPPPPTPTLFPYTTLFRSVLPDGVDRCTVIFDFYFDDVSEAAAERNRQSIAVGERVNDEDVGICEAVQRGLHSRARSEEHTSELQSLTNLVCRLLLEKKKD